MGSLLWIVEIMLKQNEPGVEIGKMYGVGHFLELGLGGVVN